MKNKKIVSVVSIAVLVIIVLIATFFILQNRNVKIAGDVKNITYKIANQSFDMKNGRAEVSIVPGSASKNVLSLFGEPVFGDLNGDGLVDAAVLLVNTSGGSGAFYYATLAINTGDGYKATEAMYLGDRIAPQTVEIHDGRAVYNFAERKGTDPMTTPPSIGKSVWVNYDKATGHIGEWVKGFEGESR